jgi:hypothetical protein
LCQRWFTSQSECARGEELWREQLAGEITDLEFQHIFWLSKEPKLTIKVDFGYKRDGKQIWDDSKGIVTREWRAKVIALKQLQGIDIILSKPRRLVDAATIERRKTNKQERTKALADTDAYLNSVIK